MTHCLFIRPRVVHGLSLIYLVALVYMLFLDTGAARESLKIFDQSLGVPLEERSYGGDCRLYTPENPHSKFNNLKETIWVRFICYTGK